MKILITTEREILYEDYWAWANACVFAMNEAARSEGSRPRIGKKEMQTLLDTGEFSFEDDLGYTKAKTTYRIVKD